MHRMILAILFQSAVLMAQVGTASIQGTVTDAASNKAVAGAYVTAIRSGLPPASQTAESASDGSFQVQALAAGDYSLCIQVPGGGYLDPCQWSGTPVKLTLTAGQKSTGNSLKISAGSVVQVRVDDPSQLLSQKTKDGRNPQLVVGVWGGNSLFHPLRVASQDSTGATFQLTIPPDTALNLQVISGDLKLANSAGAAVAAAGDQQSFQYSTGAASPPSFKYTVTAANP
jgi:hypothetical protein